jgi:iron complex transport system permease protein
MKQRKYIAGGIVVLIVLLFLGNLFYGSVSIPASQVIDILLGKDADKTAWTSIVLYSRLPQAITALLAGAALAVSGLMLQTLFQNPLAGPSILGISDGANLGVAIVLLYSGGIIGSGFSLGVNLSIILSAFAGAFFVLMLLLYFSSKLKSNILVLILGIMVGYLASSGISILNAYAAADNIRSYVMWGMGSFAGVQLAQLPFYSACILSGLFCAMLLIKPLNTLLLGERYATNLGINVRRIRLYILILTGFLTAVVTAFCGPVTFIGLAVPHVARMVLGTSNQKLLLPATLLSGVAIGLLCNMMTIIPFGKGLLPLNAVTPILGAPIIIYVILKHKSLHN